MSVKPGMQIGDKRRDRCRVGDVYRKEKRDESFVSAGVKWFMFAFNLLFFVIGLGLVGIGIWTFISSKDYKTRSGNEIDGLFDVFFDMSVMFMFFGSIVYFLSLMGMLGSLRENITLLKVYFSLLMIIFLMEASTVIAVFSLSETIRVKFQELLRMEAIEEYRTYINRDNVIDWFQETFGCCGVGDEGWRVWEQNKYFNCSSEGFEACSVPYSCCINPYTYDEVTINTRCGTGMLEEGISEAEAGNTIYTRGCVDVAINAIKDNMLILGGIAVAIVAPQLLGLFLARLLWGQIESQKSRWTV